jgi:molybdopterin molybdotransferase
MPSRDPEPLISIARAREIIAAEQRVLDSEAVPVARALGRALAEDVAAQGDVPPFANSAMDGFAVRSGPPGTRLRIAGESRAGAPSPTPLGDDEAIRISTGAALPEGADAVVPLESATEADGWVTFDDDVAAARNVRRAGDDMRAGDAVLARGTRLGAADLGVAVAAGHGRLTCTRRPRVAIVTSGDELRAPGETLAPGEIHDSNRIALSALARVAGAEMLASAAEGVGDDPAATEAALGAALQDADVLVVSGGVSVGPHDHVKAALAALGVQERFWRVALRPGKPTWFGVRGDTLVFGLPGNPVSAMVTFLLFVRATLEALQGLDPARALRTATLAADLPRHPVRDEAVRVRLEDSDRGPRAVVTGPQGSHQLTSMLGADALLIVERGEGALAAGARVQVEPIALFAPAPAGAGI